MSAETMTIEGFPSASAHRFSGDNMLNDTMLPDESMGLDLGALWPTADELMSATKAGAGVAGGLFLAKGIEKVIAKNFKISGIAADLGIPALQILGGGLVGKFTSQWDPAIGVGLASGMVALGVISLVKRFLGLDLLAGVGALDGVDISDLADLMAAGGGGSDVLPAELQDVLVEEQPRGALGSAITAEDIAGVPAGYSMSYGGSIGW